MTTFIAIGDPHFQVTNITEVNLFMERLLKLIEEKNPDFIVVLGDLLHTHERLHTIALNKAYEFIHKLKDLKPTYVLVGNHDMLNNSQHLTENHWMNGMKEWNNVTIVDKVVTLNTNDDLFVFVPYVPTGRFEEALDTCSQDWKEATCIFAHQEFYGCQMNAITSVEGDRYDEKYPHVISGHIHSKQRIQKNIYYTGSAMQHAFGESTKNIIAYLKFNNKDYELEEIDLKLPRKKIVHKNIEDIEDFEVSSENKDKIKVTVSGNYDQFKALKKTKKYKTMVKEGIKVVFKPKKLKIEKDTIPEIEKESEFRTILNKLILYDKDSFLYQVYENVVNGKSISEEDIVIL